MPVVLSTAALPSTLDIFISELTESSGAGICKPTVVFIAAILLFFISI